MPDTGGPARDLPLDRELVPVVAAVVRRDDRFLLARRPVTKRHGGLWEFPGGKIGVGETESEALARELREELGVELVGVPVRLFSTLDPGSEFEIRFMEAEIEGRPIAIEHDELRWVSLGDAGALPLAPSDRTFLESI